MNTDDFEQLLRRQPLRPVPAEWREEILAATLDRPVAASAAVAPPTTLARLRDWLWPHPVAWVGLAAGWALALLLNHAAGGPVLASLGPWPSPTSAWAHATVLEAASL